MTNFIIAQIISIISGIFLITGIRSKEKKKFLILNSMSNLAGFLSLILLSAYSACIGPIALTIQAIISYIYENKGKKTPKIFNYLFPILNILGGIFTITSPLSLLPILSSTLASIMLTSKDMKTSRKINLASSILALPYLIVNKAYVSAIIFTSSFINTLEAIYKLDYQKKKNTTNIEQEPKTETTEVADKEPTNNYTYVILILTTKTSMKKLPIKIDITTQEEKRDFEISFNVLHVIILLLHLHMEHQYN